MASTSDRKFERVSSSPDTPPTDEAPASAGRSFVHECNNLLGGILTAATLLRRAQTEADREEAFALIADAVERAKGHLGDAAGMLGLASAHRAAPRNGKRGDQTQTAAAAGGKRRVLIAEDEEMNRTLLRKLLESTGRYEVRVAATGREAIEEYRREPADLVILDLGLPDLGGADVLERLQRISGRAKALLVSGYIDPHHPLARERGVVGALQKPIEPDLLLETIAKALE